MIAPPDGSEARTRLIAVAPEELRTEDLRVERQCAFDIGAMMERDRHGQSLAVFTISLSYSRHPLLAP